MFLFKKFVQSLFVVIGAYAHDLEASDVVPFISRFQMRDFADARNAPGGPTIEKHHVAAQFLQVHFSTIQRGEFERQRSADHFKMFHHRPGGIDNQARRFAPGQLIGHGARLDHLVLVEPVFRHRQEQLIGLVTTGKLATHLADRFFKIIQVHRVILELEIIGDFLNAGGPDGEPVVLV